MGITHISGELNKSQETHIDTHHQNSMLFPLKDS